MISGRRLLPWHKNWKLRPEKYGEAGYRHNCYVHTFLSAIPGLNPSFYVFLSLCPQALIRNVMVELRKQVFMSEAFYYRWTGFEPANGPNRRARRCTTTTTGATAPGITTSRTRPRSGPPTRSRSTTRRPLLPQLPRRPRPWAARAGNEPTGSSATPDSWATPKKPSCEATPTLADIISCRGPRIVFRAAEHNRDSNPDRLLW